MRKTVNPEGYPRFAQPENEESIPLHYLDHYGGDNEDLARGSSDQYKDKNTSTKMKNERNTGISLLDSVLLFLDGPDRPRDNAPDLSHNLLLGQFERFPYHFRVRYPQWRRVVVLLGYLAGWLILLLTILVPHLWRGAHAVDENGEALEVLTMSCTGAGEFWTGKNQLCGVDAKLCLPERSEVIIKCPALCDRGWTYSSTPVGNEMVKYRQYSIGGGAIPKGDQKDYDLTYPYRGDSFPCSSAVHSGVVSSLFGGCARLKFDGAKLSFDSRQGHYGTGFSVGFDSFFPSSFKFARFSHGMEVSGCYDPRLVVLFINFILGLPLIYMASGEVSFWILSVIGFWTVILTLDPPIIADAREPQTVATLISIGFERLLPLCFVLYVFWSTTVKRTMSDPTSPVAKVGLWYPLFWIGIANNLTFDRLPVDRLTPNDIMNMPGSFLTFILILAVLIISSLVQGYHVWLSGRLVKYAMFYCFVTLGLIILACLPGLGLRVHHYILGMMLLPGTATRGWSAFVLQGVLLGLMISGIARWDFASVVESNVSLMRGEAGSSMEPPLNFTYIGDGSVSWVKSEDSLGDLPGYSLLINDVERYVGNSTTLNIKHLIDEDLELKKIMKLALAVNDEVPLYLRLARASLDHDSRNRGDYTRSGVLIWPNGNWTLPEKGVT